MTKLALEDASVLFDTDTKLQKIIEKNYKKEKIKIITDIVALLDAYVSEWNIEFYNKNSIIFKSNIPIEVLLELKYKYLFFENFDFQKILNAANDNRSEIIHAEILNSFNKLTKINLEIVKNYYLDFFKNKKEN